MQPEGIGILTISPTEIMQGIYQYYFQTTEEQGCVFLPINLSPIKLLENQLLYIKILMIIAVNLQEMQVSDWHVE